jgi:hypothetical protein
VCHEKVGKIGLNDQARLSVLERFKDDIYRPGDPVPEESLTISEKRQEVMEALREAGRLN